MGRFLKQLKRLTNNSNYTNDSINHKNESLESLVPSGKVVFFGGYEGSDQQIPYTYEELHNIFKEIKDEQAIRFYHEAKKYGKYKFIKEVEL